MSAGDILPALTTAAGIGATIFGAPGVGLPLAASGLGGLFGGGQTGAPAGATTPTTQPSTAQQIGSTLTQVAPAAQDIFNAMGLNPTQRAQTATPPPAAPAPALQSSRGLPQGLGIPQPQAPIQSAGTMSTAGTGAMAPAQNPQMGSQLSMMNPQLQQILALLGRPY